MKKILSFSIAAMLSIAFAFGQPGLTLPNVSQKVKIKQTIGISDFAVVYHSPKVNDREIWGTTVPYDQVWRCGANDNTVVYFSDNVMVEGQELTAGTYGLHMIPTKGDWTIIFSKNHSSWGSYFYKEEEDALRVTVTPTEAPHREYLSYFFENPASDGADLTLYWEKMAIPISIKVATHDVVMASMNDELRSLPGFSWNGPNQAANYCLQNEVNMEQGLKWAEQSVGNQANFNNLTTKSNLQAKLGYEKEAASTMDEALAIATNMEMYQYGAGFIGQQKNEEAMEVMQMMSKKYPDTWITYAGLAAGNRVNNHPKDALKYYKMAHEGAPDQWKPSLEQRIKSMEDALSQSNR